MAKCISFGYLTPALIVGINFSVAVGYFDARQQTNTCDQGLPVQNTDFNILDQIRIMS